MADNVTKNEGQDQKVQNEEEQYNEEPEEMIEDVKANDTSAVKQLVEKNYEEEVLEQYE